MSSEITKKRVRCSECGSILVFQFDLYSKSKPYNFCLECDKEVIVELL